MNWSRFLWILFTLLGNTVLSVCIPRHKVTALAIGQDIQSISNYRLALKHDPNPFAVMSYISLILKNNTIAGLQFPADYGSGVEWVEGLINKFDGSSIQLGLWISDSYGSIAIGKYDKSLQIFSNYIKQSDRDFYLRIGYEFDSVVNNLDPALYRAAFRYIVKYFRKTNVSNIAFVWHAAGFQPRDNLSHSVWFPGSDVVDWCGISLFQQPYYCGTHANCTSMYYADKFANYCSQRRLPLMIAESTPFGGILEAAESSTLLTATSSSPATVVNRAGYVGDTWEIWFEPVLAYIDRHDVRMWSYINCNWDEQPMWAEQHAPGIYWGDTRIEAHPALLARWKEEVLKNPQYLGSYEAAIVGGKCEPVAEVLLHGGASGNHHSTAYLAEISVAVWCGASVLVVLLLCCSKLCCTGFSGTHTNNMGEYTALP